MALSLSLLAAAMACALIFVARAHVHMLRTFGVISRNHREDLRVTMNFAMNTARVYSNEFLRAGIRSSVPEVDKAITQIQETYGGDRAEAVSRYLASLSTENHANGESS